MKFQNLTILLLITVFAISCMNSSNQSQDNPPAAIALNNGAQWLVNSEMTPFILEGEKILNAHDGSDYKALAKQLKNKNKSLIKSCTMKGESHDELHKWLHPHMQLVAALEDVENEQRANIIIADLNKSFQTFHTYFK